MGGCAQEARRLGGSDARRLGYSNFFGSDESELLSFNNSPVPSFKAHTYECVYDSETSRLGSTSTASARDCKIIVTLVARNGKLVCNHY